MGEKTEEKREVVSRVEELFEKFITQRFKLLDTSNTKRFSPEAMHSVLVMPKVIQVESCVSSNIESFGYDKRSKVLSVMFKSSGEYRYLAVSPEYYNLMKKSPSKGKALLKIKIMHAFIKINENAFFDA